jgi:class 3 adenylate cyclase/TolB-like protein
MERRLAAILAADVVGYSRLIEADETATFERLRAHRKELFEPEIEKHHGRIFKLMGDGILAEFSSVVDAVECAVVLQRGMAERNDGVADDQRIYIRIGINLGEVILEGEDRHGEGVVIAARLQQLAEPGGIALSRTVVENVKHKLAFGFKSLGEHRVKNIAEPISVYRVAVDASASGPMGSKRHRAKLRPWRAVVAALFLLLAATAGWYGYEKLRSEPAAVASTPDSAIGVPMIVVLPFQNLTGDPAHDKLGIGITEDLRDLLWNFPEFQVVSGTSSVGQTNDPADIRDIARGFAAQFVIEGTVRRGGNGTVITAQLIDGMADTHLWSTRFEQASNDPTVLEKAAADTLSNSLGGMTGRMREAYERIAWSKPEAELTEYDYYVRGHTHHLRFTNEELHQAREIYAAGLERFPDSPLLRIKIAFVHYSNIYRVPRQEVAYSVVEMQRLAADSARFFRAGRRSRFEEYYFHWISTFTHQAVGDFAACIAKARAAVKLTPYDAWVRGTLVPAMAECGNPEEAVAWAKEAIRREPDGPSFWPEYYFTGLAWASYLAGHYDECVEVIQGMDDGPAQVLAACYVRLGQPQQARDTLAAFVKERPDWIASDQIRLPLVDDLRRRWFDDIRAAGGTVR